MYTGDAVPGIPVDFTPQLDADNVAWFDGRSGVTLASGNVSAWANQSAAADANSHLAQATGGLRPALSAADADCNGEDAIVFTGAEYLDSGTWVAPVAQPLTFYFVIKPSATSAYVLDDIDGSSRIALYVSGSGFYFAGNQTPGLPTVNDTLQIVCFVLNGDPGSAGFRSNPITQKVGSGGFGGPGSNPLTSTRIGAKNDGGEKYAGKLVCWGAFAGAHDGARRAEIFAGLTARYMRSPSDISGLYYWNKNESLVAGAVSSWPDSSPSPLADATITGSPVVATNADFAGKLTVPLVGSGTAAMTTPALTLGPQAVFVALSTIGSGYPIHRDDPSNPEYVYFATGATVLHGRGAPTAAKNNDNAGWWTDFPRVTVVKSYDGTLASLKLRVNGVEQTMTDIIFDDPGASATAWPMGISEGASADVAEVIVYNRDLTLSEKQAVEAYLLAKFWHY